MCRVELLENFFELFFKFFFYFYFGFFFVECFNINLVDVEVGFVEFFGDVEC